MSAKIDITGKRFGRLTVISEAGRKRKEVAWLCKCDCGNTIVTNGYGLRSGHVQSCGCYMKDRIRQTVTKHGECNSKLYKTYYNMKNRCYNPHYYLFQHYGGKGITLSEEWLGENGYMNFVKWSLENGYNEELSIDRIDNSKGYSPENCRWTDMRTQQNNRTNNRRVTIHNETHTAAQWARLLNVSYAAFQKHLYDNNYLTWYEDRIDEYFRQNHNA